MAEGYKPHELLLSGDYWESQDLTHPRLTRRHLILEMFSGGTHTTALGTALKVRKLYKLASQSGYVPEEITPGSELPLLPRGEGLLRVIRDYKSVRSTRDLSRMEREQTDAEEFDVVAEQILANKLYGGQPAGLTVLNEGALIRLDRTASYLTSSRTGQILEGVRSQHIGGNNDFETSDICFPIVVGETYASGKNRDELFKVVKAEILVPGSGSKSKAQKTRSKVKFVPVVA